MRILITGGAGFIGSTIAEKLLERGDTVYVIDNFSTGRRDNLPKHANLTLVEDSIANKDIVTAAFKAFKPEIVVHAAAAYKDPNAWQEDVLTNILGTVHIVQASKEHAVNRLIYFQTSLCYGLKPLEQPITLNHPLFSGAYPGGSSYAISKTAGEQYIELSGLDFISFRLANAYGPKNVSGPPPTFYQRLTQGKPCFIMDTRRDFVYIDDLVEVVIKAIGGQGSRGYYHIATGRDFSIKELFDAVVEALDIQLTSPVEERPRGVDDAPTLLIDPSKTERDFAWKAKTPLREGIQRAVDYYRRHGVTETFTHLKIAENKH